MLAFNKEITHQWVDHLSQLIHKESLSGVPNDLLNAYLFNVKLILEWSKHFFPHLTIEKLIIYESMDRNLSMIELSNDYSMLAR